MASENPPAKATSAKKPQPIKQLFLKVKPCSIILLLKDAEQPWYPSKLARAAGMSYVHSVSILSSLRAYGFAVAEKKGKQNLYKLTERGAYLALTLDDLVKKCDAAEAERKAPRQEPQPAHAAAEAPAAAKAEAKEKAEAKPPAEKK